MKRIHSLPRYLILMTGALLCLATTLPAADPGPRTKERQTALTPERVLEKLQAGNERFVQNRNRERDHLRDVDFTAKGQYPIAAIVGCMDSRAPLALIFDQGVGDIFAIGIAGNVINPDIIGSLEYAGKVVGVKVVLVLGHTECGAVKGAIDHVELGSLTGLLEKIDPAIEMVPASMQPRTAKNKEFVDAVAEANVRRAVKQVRADSDILAELEKRGTIKIVGGLYNVSTGRVAILD